MTVRFEDVTVACYSGRDFIQIMNATGYIDPLDAGMDRQHGQGDLGAGRYA